MSDSRYTEKLFDVEVCPDKADELIHAHAVLSRTDGSALGGHILIVQVWPTLEISPRWKGRIGGVVPRFTCDLLQEPIPGDHGAHGDFDARAMDFSPQFWMTTHARSLGVAGLAGLALAAFILLNRK